MAVQMEAACSTLAAAGHKVQTAIRAGEVELALHAYQEEQGIDRLVMGAYGILESGSFWWGAPLPTCCSPRPLRFRRKTS